MSKVATRWQITSTAASQIGYVEGGGRDGRSGNITKFWAAHYPAWQGSAWCGAFVYWVLQKRGVKDVPLGKTGIFYTPSIVNAAKSLGAWRDDSQLSRAKPGDIVLFDFDGSNYAKHVGFIEKQLGNGNVQTIEGNTSAGTSGSQNDGGGVYRRVRNTGSIMGYVDMDTWLAKDGAELRGQTKSAAAKPKPTALRKEWLSKKIAEHRKFSVGTIRRLQAEVNVTIDGIAGPATKKAVQKWLGVSQDGIWGKQTYSAMQKKFGASKTTGRWTPWLVGAMQNYLNENRR